MAEGNFWRIISSITVDGAMSVILNEHHFLLVSIIIEVRNNYKYAIIF